MDREYVSSKSIRSRGYDPSTGTLEIEFLSGVVWQYYNFSESDWYNFKAADSVGKYFYANIRDKYSGSRIG